MAKVKIEQLNKGMVVAEDVKNLDNMLLIPTGTKLTERHINILQAWGVFEVEVEVADGAAPASDPFEGLPAELLAQATADVRSRFHRLDEHEPAANEVFQVMLRRRVRRHTNSK